MKLLLSIRNRIEDIYYKRPVLTGYIVRFALALAVLMILRANLGFNEILSNFLFVVIFSAVSAFVPIKPLVFILVAYTVVQIFSLSSGVGLFACLLFIVMYFLYFRFSENTGYMILLIPLLYMIRLPIFIPLILAVAAPAGSVVSVVLGYIVYFFLRYIHVNAAVFQGTVENGEVRKLSMVISGVFTYREMWYATGCIILMFFIVYYLKRININRSNEMAMAIGSGIYLIVILICYLIFGNITSQKLLQAVIGCAISCFLAMLVSSIVLPLDYSRTELLEFEDEEYKYYVRAVPKSRISRESVRIKRIYSRKQAFPEREKERSKEKENEK